MSILLTNIRKKNMKIDKVIMSCDDNSNYLDLWPFISKVCKTSGYFNISLIGQSILTEILIMLSYIEQYGYPDEIYFLTPETSRNIIYVKKDVKNFISVNMNSDPESFDIETVMNSYLNSIVYLKFLESFCTSNNIKLLWSSWDNDELVFFEKMNFKYFFKLDTPDTNKEIKNIFNLYQDSNQSVELNLIKQDGHKGLIFHKYWADQFYRKAGYEKNN